MFLIRIETPDKASVRNDIQGMNIQTVVRFRRLDFDSVSGIICELATMLASVKSHPSRISNNASKITPHVDVSTT
jgi:hypothetical protein